MGYWNLYSVGFLIAVVVIKMKWVKDLGVKTRYEDAMHVANNFLIGVKIKIFG